MSDDEVVLAIRQNMDEADWESIKPHAARDAVILVAHGLNLLEVAVRVARDDKRAIDEWIAAGQLAKPTLDQLTSWDKQPSKPFMTVIIQPFVLVQEIVAH